MCGVLGIKSLRDAQLKLIDARNLLQLLVHRGQDASGLSWLDNYNVHQTEKNKGAPIGIMIPEDEQSFTIIGSTRYPTIGNRAGSVSKNRFAQPFSYQTNLGTLSICHNGNITNMSVLTEKNYQSDAEFITERLGQLINETGSIEDALIKLSDELDGSYSLVGILGKDLFCFRDPHAIRPLIAGSNSSFFVATSESIVLQQAGISPEHQFDVQPGELVYVTDKQFRKKILVKPQNIAHCYFEYVYFASSISTIDGQNVYNARLNLGKELGNELLKKNFQELVDYVVPVPDTSKSACETISEILNKPLREAIMKNRTSLRTFIMPGVDFREVAVKSKYLFVDEYIKDKRLLIVDDSIVRGLTTKFLINILRERGAKEVHVAITCPPQRYACYYGVDFGTDTELIARNNKSVDEICKEIKADSLNYLSLEGLRKAINLPDLCDACLTGNYPTKFGQTIRTLIANGKIQSEKSHYEAIKEQA